jgi:ABC-2 type transport system permease protein
VRGQIRSEILKLRTVWSTWLITTLAVFLSLLLSLLVAFVRPDRVGVANVLQPLRGSARWFDNIFATMGIVQDLTLVLGVLIVTGEYRHKTVTPTYLAEPRRGRVTAAKLVAAALGGLAVAGAVGLVGLVFGFILLGVGDGTSGVMLAQYGRIIPGVFGAAVLFAVYGLGLGSILKNQVVAIVVGLVFSFVIEPIIEGLAPQVAKYFPGYAAQALAGSAARGISRAVPLVSWWEGAALLLAYGVVLAAAGSFTTLRADVT